MKNLSYGCSQEDLKEVFDQAVDIRIPKGQNGQNRGYGTITTSIFWIFVLYSVTYAGQPYMMTTKGLNTDMCDVNVNFLIRLAIIIPFCSICSKILL